MTARIIVAMSITFCLVYPQDTYSSDRPMPNLSVEVACDAAALDPRNDDGYREVYARCIADEQKSYNILKSLWPQIENKVVDYCNGAYGEIGAKKFARIDFYQIYLPCVQFIGPGYFQGKADRDQVRREFQFQR